MSEEPTQAMVLAAGLGTRMAPLTNTTPKPLIEVAGKPLIDYALDRFADAGVVNAIVNVHYLADQIERHLETRVRPEITISDEREMLLETGGGLQKARHFFDDAPLFCTNTDAILIDEGGGEACASLKVQWASGDMDALLLLAPIERASGYDGAGDFSLNEDGRIAFREGAASPFVFTGLQIISPQLVDEGPGGAYSTKILWQRAASRGRLFGAVHQGDWLHVGDRQGLVDAERRLAGGVT